MVEVGKTVNDDWLKTWKDQQQQCSQCVTKQQNAKYVFVITNYI